MMNIYSLVASVSVAAASLSGCASTVTEPAATATGTPVDYSCEPRIAANWEGKPMPPEVKAADDKDWRVAITQFKDVYVYYFRDCGVNVRGPETEFYPREGANLAATFCRGDKMSGNIFADPEPNERGITQSMVDTTMEVIEQLQQSDICSNKVITPIS